MDPIEQILEMVAQIQELSGVIIEVLSDAGGGGEGGGEGGPAPEGPPPGEEGPAPEGPPPGA